MNRRARRRRLIRRTWQTPAAVRRAEAESGSDMTVRADGTAVVRCTFAGCSVVFYRPTEAEAWQAIGLHVADAHLADWLVRWWATSRGRPRIRRRPEQ